MADVICPNCGEKLQHIKFRTDTETLTPAEVMSRLQEAEERTGLRGAYDAILGLQADLRFEIQAYTLLSDASREIRALAACYELQDYLANRIAEELDMEDYTEVNGYDELCDTCVHEEECAEIEGRQEGRGWGSECHCPDADPPHYKRRPQ